MIARMINRIENTFTIEEKKSGLFSPMPDAARGFAVKARRTSEVSVTFRQDIITLPY